MVDLHQIARDEERKVQAAGEQKDEDEGSTRNGKRPLEARCGMLGRMMEQKEIDRVKTMAALSDVIIFMFLGIVTISKRHTYHFEFSFWTVVACIFARFFCTYVLSAFLNRRRIKTISKREQFIMAYGGLRGAVGFSLVTILDDSNPFKEIFQTTTLIVIFITVFIQGSTIKPLVNILNIQKSETVTKRLIGEDVNDKCIDLLMAGKVMKND